MATVLISNLAPLDVASTTMFSALFAGCQERGHECAFWSCIHRQEHSDHYLPMRWDLALWESQYYSSALAQYRDERPLVDVAKWLPRIDRLCKQGVPRGQRYNLFRTVYAVSRAILDELQPNLYIAWNHLCPHGGIMADLCRDSGIPVYLLERGPLPDTWYFETGGLLGHSSLVGVPLESLIQADQWKETAALGKRVLEGLRFDSFNRYPQRAGTECFKMICEEDSFPGPKIAFFPPDDTTLGFTPEHGEDRRKSLPGFVSSYEAAIHLAKANPRGITLFKPHPSFLEENIPERHESGLITVDEDFRRLIDWSDIVATSGSGLQFLAMAAGKPIISMGVDVITGKGISYEAREAVAVYGAVRCADERQNFAERTNRFYALMGQLISEHFLSLEAENGKRPHKAILEVCNKYLAAASNSNPGQKFREARKHLAAPEGMALTSH